MQSVRVFGVLISLVLIGGFLYGAFLLGKNDMDIGQVLEAPDHQEFDFKLDLMSKRFQISKIFVPAIEGYKREKYELTEKSCDFHWIVTTDMYASESGVMIEFMEGDGECTLKSQEIYFVQYQILSRIKRNTNLKKVEKIIISNPKFLNGYKGWSAQEFLQKAWGKKLKATENGVFSLME